MQSGHGPASSDAKGRALWMLVAYETDLSSISSVGLSYYIGGFSQSISLFPLSSSFPLSFSHSWNQNAPENITAMHTTQMPGQHVKYFVFTMRVQKNCCLLALFLCLPAFSELSFCQTLLASNRTTS